jgi:predicted ATPase
MLTRLTVQGFKSLRDVKDIELGVVNVFIGANGSGKSNLLEALGFLSAVIDRKLDDQALLRRGVRSSVPHLYQSAFKATDSQKKIYIQSLWELAEDIAEFQIEIHDIVDARQRPWSIEPTFKLNGQDAGNDLEVVDRGSFPIIIIPNYFPEPFTRLNDLVAMLSNYAVFSPNTPTLRGISPDITQREPIGLAGGQLAEAVDDLLDVNKGMFGTLELDELYELLDWVDEIGIEAPSRELISPSVPTLRNIIVFTDRWMGENRNRLSAYDASEGALYVLFALVLAVHPKSPQLFAIDNFDQAMHPRLARATTRLFCQQMLQADPPRQALLTTHNPLVLDGLDLRDDRIRLFAVERDSKGATQVYRVNVSDQILEDTQSGLPLSSLWVMGRLGAVPDLF